MDQNTAETGIMKNLPDREFRTEMQERPTARLLDVRTYFEYASGHLPDAELFDMMDPEFSERIEALDRAVPYFVYCRSGSRSFQAAMYMRELGFREVYNLADGIISWSGDVVTD